MSLRDGPSELPPPSTTEAVILDAALQVIGERGLKGATTRLIAQRAGVNEVTVFRKFGTKNLLIRAAIESRFEAASQEFALYTGDVEADLARLASGYQAALQRFGPAARVILAEVPHDPELSRDLRGPGQLFAAIGELLVRYQQVGVLRPEAVETLVPAFLGPIVIPFLTGFSADTRGRGATGVDVEQHVSRFLHGRAAQ